MTKLTAIIPTCEPDSMFKFLLPTSYRLTQLKDILEFNIIFQPPYTVEDMEKVVNTLNTNGFKVNYTFKDYRVIKPYTPLIRMRNDCALMSPKSDYYIIWDDDISIESELACDYIQQAIKNLDENLNLAAVSLYNQPINNHRENFYSTNGGLIVRGGKYYGFDGYMPNNLNEFGNIHTLMPYEHEDLVNLFGGFQDKFGVMCRLCTGQQGMSIINVPINHVENRKEKGSMAHGWDQAKFEIGSIANFIEKYFNPRFLETHSLTLFDRSLDRDIYPDHYETNGKLKPEWDLYSYRGFSWEFNFHNLENWFLENPETDLSLYWHFLEEHPQFKEIAKIKNN